MNTNTMHQIDIGDVIIISQKEYYTEKRDTYIQAFDAMCADGVLMGNYTDDKWVGYTGIKSFGIDLEIDQDEYEKHIGTHLRIPYDVITDMLRCYVIYIVGSYIFSTINNKVDCIKQFLCSYGERRFTMQEDGAESVKDFLRFIGYCEMDIERFFLRIQIDKCAASKPREMSHLINYLAIEKEIRDIFTASPTDDEFCRWFPIFFWCEITFCIPLRATEMLVTPCNCITHKDGKTYITLRRTTLKAGRRSVHYNVEEDYKLFTYEIPNQWVAHVIEKYQYLTSNHSRKYLFRHSKYMINKMVSLQSFNMLLEEFVKTRIIGNAKYEYAKFVTGIDEYEVVTAGDSRPIAMANLFFSKVPADICRQLADHAQISTSYGYYSNVAETINCATIMKVQDEINSKSVVVENNNKQHKIQREQLARIENIHNVPTCRSPKRPLQTGNIEDCIEEGQLYECLGCKYYMPSEEELEQEYIRCKQRLDKESKAMFDDVVDVRKGKKNDVDFDKVFLDLHTAVTRYEIMCEKKAREGEIKWRRQQSMTKAC